MFSFDLYDAYGNEKPCDVRFAKKTNVVVVGKGIFVEHRFWLSVERNVGSNLSIFEGLRFWR